MEDPHDLVSIGKEKSDRRKHLQCRDSGSQFSNRGNGLNGLANARICPREKHNEQQKTVADAGAGHVGGALERLDYGPAALLWPPSERAL